MTDFTIADHGSVVIVTPQSETARGWVSEFIMEEEAQKWGNGFVVEPRYLNGLIEGIHEAGMEVSR